MKVHAEGFADEFQRKLHSVWNTATESEHGKMMVHGKKMRT